MKKSLQSLFSLGCLISATSIACAADDSQQYKVSVPQRITMTAPAATVSATLPDSSSSLSFPAQNWQIKGNSSRGVLVTFKTQGVFENTSDSNFKRDARLTLGGIVRTGPAFWYASGSLTDVTDYANGDEEAAVSIFSDNAGQGVQSVYIDFLTVDIGEVMEGAYTMTLEGTVTEN